MSCPITAPAMHVDVQIASDAAGIPARDDIRRWVERALNAVEPGCECEVSVRVVDEAEMRALNREFRGRDKPTNVLSFPSGSPEGLPDGALPLLGDIVVCAPVVAAEAAEQDKDAADHWGHLLVHGSLHLLGFDHVAEAEARDMEHLETRILAQFGVADPYDGN